MSKGVTLTLDGWFYYVRTVGASREKSRVPTHEWDRVAQEYHCARSIRYASVER